MKNSPAAQPAKQKISMKMMDLVATANVRSPLEYIVPFPVISILLVSAAIDCRRIII